MDGKIIEIRDGATWKRLGKFARVTRTGVFIFTADVDTGWRDPYLAGWSLNYALWLASQQAPWHITMFYLFEKGRASTYSVDKETIVRRMKAGGKKSWGQNITIEDHVWTSTPGSPPKTSWIPGDREEHFLRLEPIYIPRDVLRTIGSTAPLSDEERAQKQVELDVLLGTIARGWWTSDEPEFELRQQAYAIWRELREDRGKSSAPDDFSAWLKTGGEISS